MSKLNVRILIVLLIMMLATAACEFSASTAKVKDAYMSSDEEGANRTEIFTQDQPFYCIVELTSAPDDTTVKAVWTAVEVTDTDPNMLIDEYEVTTGDGTIPFSLINDGLWPTGKYKVEIYLNDKLDKTIEFAVE